ncbi:MAG: hypothetical protein KJ621_01320 [Proteobacteria bacterium]|nr:hypothetical protein [Pseudomonadota bacterium]MBU1740685.1 hypothetical protein [Pseudomonadota bacterium]
MGDASVDDTDLVDLNEAFAVQALCCANRWGMKPSDRRLNKWGGSIANGHPLALSGHCLQGTPRSQIRPDDHVRRPWAGLCRHLGEREGVSIVHVRSRRN